MIRRLELVSCFAFIARDHAKLTFGLLEYIRYLWAVSSTHENASFERQLQGVEGTSDKTDDLTVMHVREPLARHLAPIPVLACQGTLLSPFRLSLFSPAKVSRRTEPQEQSLC